MITESDISCGVSQLSRLGRPPKTLIREAFDHNEAGKEWSGEFIHLLFSDSLGRGDTLRGGQKLAEVIRKENLGRLFVTRSRKNPNSPNQIKTWMWSINWQEVKNYLR